MDRSLTISTYRHAFPIQRVRSFLLLGLLVQIQFSLGEERKSLYQHCSDVVDGNSTYVMTEQKIEHYLRLCRDANRYVKCILNTRGLERAPEGVVIQPYEISFPEEDDLKRAAYLFCVHNLPHVYRTFSPRKPIATKDRSHSCFNLVDKGPCRSKFITQAKLDALRMARDSLDAISVKDISCEVSAKYADCVESLYMKCDEEYRFVKDFELAQFGGQCLLASGVYSSLVSEWNCVARTNTGSTPASSKNANLIPALLAPILSLVSLTRL